jgi:hypothetical protein
MRRFPAPTTDRCHAIGRVFYLASRESAKRANNVAGPGYISTNPACRSELSSNPPQSTPIPPWRATLLPLKMRAFLDFAGPRLKASLAEIANI